MYLLYTDVFFSFDVFKARGKPLRSFHAVPHAKMSSARSCSSSSLVKKLSKKHDDFSLSGAALDPSPLSDPTASHRCPPCQCRLRTCENIHYGCQQEPTPWCLSSLAQQHVLLQGGATCELDHRFVNCYLLVCVVEGWEARWKVVDHRPHLTKPFVTWGSPWSESGIIYKV